jgi:protein-disulfide isomerase
MTYQPPPPPGAPYGPQPHPWYRQFTSWLVAVVFLVAGAAGGYAIGRSTGSDEKVAAGPATASPQPAGEPTAQGEGAGTASGAAEKPAETPAQPAAEAKPPQGATSTMGIELGQNLEPGGPKAADAVEVDLVFDYLCPFCKQLEDTRGAELRQLAEKGDITLVLHPVAILDRLSSTQYSTRAAGAAVAVAALDPAHFEAFDQALWANQPAENGPGLSDAELAGLAEKAGVSKAAVEQLADPGFQAWATQATQSMSSVQGFTGTPWVLMSYAGGPRHQVDWSSIDFAKAAQNVKEGKAPQ